jgi:hypothetical protein
MLIYEVNLTVDREIISEYSKWLDPHIKEIIAIEGFRSASWFTREPSSESEAMSGKAFWTIQYHLENRKSYESYIQNHAPRMRQQAADRFGDRVAATRRVLELFSSYH